MDLKKFYIIQGFTSDASVYRYGKSILNLHKDLENFEGKTFWDLNGKDYTNTRWFIAIGKNSKVVGTCSISPSDSDSDNYLLSHLTFTDIDYLGHDLIRSAIRYTGSNKIIYHATNKDEQEKAVRLGGKKINNTKNYIFS